MACMEHVCRDCGWVWFDNQPHPLCTKCGGCQVAHHFDEEPMFELPDTEVFKEEEDECSE